MSTIFGITDEKMKETSSTWTVNEIYQQPTTWEKTCRQIMEHKDEIQKFIDQVITKEDFDVILTGRRLICPARSRPFSSASDVPEILRSPSER